MSLVYPKFTRVKRYVTVEVPVLIGTANGGFTVVDEQGPIRQTHPTWLSDGDQVTYNIVETQVGGGEFTYTIEIEPGWQQIAIPAKYGQWNNGALEKGVPPVIAKVGEYVFDQLIDKYGPGCIEVITTKFGDTGFQWNFLPTTPRNSVHNFALMPLDPETNQYEIVGFWIKSLHPTDMILDVTEWRT